MSRSDKVIVGIITIGILGVLCERLFSAGVRRTMRWGIDDSWS
jgi:sulfonate transport system permease protein